jgi:endonuclease YncB( thermonuclease family)
MPHTRFPVFVLVLLLVACGGGGGSDPPAGGASSAASAQSAALCGVPVSGTVVTGTVTRVHDGDTITLVDAQGELDVRLQGIDAPELAQAFGAESRAALAALLLGKQARVAYASTDEYGRALGEVFGVNCEHANLKQVTAGMAWFYRAFQCELPASLRDQFAHAQLQAQQAHAGLWSQRNPEPPWVFRNGHEAEVPVCK